MWICQECEITGFRTSEWKFPRVEVELGNYLRCMLYMHKEERLWGCRFRPTSFLVSELGSVEMKNVYFLNEDKKVCWTEMYFWMCDEWWRSDFKCSIYNCKWTECRQRRSDSNLTVKQPECSWINEEVMQVLCLVNFDLGFTNKKQIEDWWLQQRRNLARKELLLTAKVCR